MPDSSVEVERSDSYDESKIFEEKEAKIKKISKPKFQAKKSILRVSEQDETNPQIEVVIESNIDIEISQEKLYINFEDQKFDKKNLKKKCSTRVYFSHENGNENDKDVYNG